MSRNQAHKTGRSLVFLNHHARKLALIRTHRARTRLQLIWMTYTYLRDSRSIKLVSQGLQAKQTDALREELDGLRSLQSNRNNTNRNTRGSDGPGGNQGGYNRQGNTSGGGGNNHQDGQGEGHTLQC